MIIDITNDFSIDIGNGTDVGKVRQKNEDYLESFESPFGYVFVVCDGMGGHTAGEVASRLAVATIKENILNNPQGVTNTKQIIIDSVNLANHRIIEKWTDEPELKGMGTTAVVLIVKTNIAYYAHVGDSRMYMIRNSKIYQMTRDHSFVQTLVDGGLISYEEAEHHPRKNEIMQALGITSEIKVDVNNIGLNLYKNDTFIMCSDGLSGLITDEDIQRIVNTNDPQEASLKLLATANNNGGFDNITVQVVKVVKGISIPKGKEEVVPLGALDKKANVLQQNPFKPHSFDKTAEIPSFNNLQSKKKNKTMLYVLLVALILIFAGLVYWKINGENKKTNEVSLKSINVNKYRIIADLSKSLNSKFTDTTEISIDYSNFNFIFRNDQPNIYNLDNLKSFVKTNNIIRFDPPLDTLGSDYKFKIIIGEEKNDFIITGVIITNNKFKVNEIIVKTEIAKNNIEIKDKSVKEKDKKDKNQIHEKKESSKTKLPNDETKINNPSNIKNKENNGDNPKN
ncbi:MAG: Stp1/IreP family PP2C-type Ser/Thr phosphatase [Ignavibacteriae bacterium]|nr:Stp1/IreP family PP2C-type Ser/Thr phosphatase [Ignavibacteriota bacterium]